MNGLAAQTAVTQLRADDHGWLADALTAEFVELRAERDKARDLAVRYEAEIHRATAMARRLHHEIETQNRAPQKNRVSTNA